MPVRKIELYGSPVLRQPAAPIDEITPEILELLRDMVDTMRFAGGAGLAANQVGVPLRVMVIDLGANSEEENLVYFINPEFTLKEGEAVQEEGCLSVPEIYEKVTRPKRVRVKALDRDGKPFELEGEQFLGKALCHEMDHLDGVIFVDRLGLIRRDLVKRKIRKMIREGEWENYYEKKAAKK